MKKSFMILSVLISALVVPGLTESASAAQISFVSVAGNWHDPVDNVPGNQPGQPVITNGVPTSSINWGVANGPQSGYDFSRTIPGTQTLPPAPTPFFPLGTFTHRNFPVSDPSLTSVQLDVVLTLNVDGVQTGPLNFTFTFNHVETPNSTRPCPYPTPNGEGCTDRVTFVSAPSPTTFRVAGVDYTLSMSFVDSSGNPVAEFITRESRVNTANLVGQFTVAPQTGPVLTVRKSGPSSMNAGQWGNFAIDAQNAGAGDAWNASIRDVLPDGATGGMCDLTPEILSARVFAADGVTTIPGKGPLNAGTDYSLSYSAAPNCRLDLTMLTGAGRIGPNERLIIRYRTQLDNNTQNGVALTNVAGAIRWFNDSSANPNRTVANRTLTNGTPGVLDHEDAFTVTSMVPATFLVQKISTDLIGDPNILLAGETLRYMITVRNTGGSNATNVTLRDAVPANTSYVASSTRLNGAAVADVAGQSPLVNGMPINSLPAGATATITFDVVVNQNVAAGTVISNQGFLTASGTADQPSDDPDTPSANDPTRDTVGAPAAATFQVLKVSTDLTGDPNLLLANETLRYTLTVRNIGGSNATNVTLRDVVPANTTYVAGSTRLNGAAVADVAGASPLVNSMPINSPADPTPGSLPVGATATITFDVVVNNVAAGTVISNQGFVTAAASGTVDQPSDDPDTPSANDPTRDTVGTPGGPAFQVQKISTDLTNDPNVLLAGETLRYTLTIRNIGTGDSANITLRDAVPANTTYVAGSTRLNGAAVADVAGQSPLVNSMPINALPIGASATITFDVVVNQNTAAGTVISNQGFVTAAANGINDQPSDDPDTPSANDPTRDTVGTPAGAAFQVQKISTDLTGDPNVLLAGETLRYTLTIRNTGSGDAANITLRDAVPANTTYVAGSTRLNGAAVADVAGQSPLVNSMPTNSLPAGATATVTFDVVVNANVASGTVISNQGFVSAPASGINDQPSDDPDTPAPNDPTRDIVVTPAAPAFLVQKVSADLAGDPNVLYPGEPLRYTITVKNTGNSNATNLTLRDAVPANTTYVNGTARLNGAAVDDVAGQSPLVNGLAINALPAGATATITFNVMVNPSVGGGTVISNQGFLTAADNGINDQPSDDPDTPTPNDPTRDIVVARPAPAFLVQKISTDLTGDPNLLLAGETLRYTITLRNTGNDDAANVTVRDAVPANTTYVASSTTLNGAPVADVFGVSPLVNGMSINSLPAGTTATLTFDVVVNANVDNGTVISNQGFVSAPASGINDQPSDDPDTPALNDPTQDTVGIQSAQFLVHKISTDQTGDPNILLPGETLRYTITVRNTGNGPAANVTLRDAVPVNTTYVASSTRLNGAPVADVVGVSPLVNGMPINSLPAGTTATITFDVLVNVNANVVSGTVISNQGFVSAPASGIVDQPSDDPDTPAPNDPTLDTVGGAASFLVQKISTDLTGDPNLLLAGETLRYTITLRNTGNGDAMNVTLRDTVPANTIYVASSTTLNGAPVADAGGQSALVNGMPINSLPAGFTVTITFDVVVNANVGSGTVISNQGFVSAPASGIVDQPSDDPDTPAVNDPTRDTVGGAATFLVQKISTDLTGDPNLLLAGETLRYTITVRNSGNGDAVNVTLRDVVPANTAYVVNSTRLNGTPVADAGGVSALVNGMEIYSLPAGTTATITFDVVVNANVASGTVISNQGFVSAPASGINDQPSDDPDTAAPNDPTRDTVGASATTFVVQKISTDLTGDPNVLLAGETLRYTITVRNMGGSDAVNVTLRDAMPANTAYVAGSTTLNGAPVADAAGQSAVVNGMPINAIPAGGQATVTFEVAVNGKVASGTVISNQGFVSAPASGINDQPSDDPDTPAPNDPTRDIVGGASTFLVQKISTDLMGDPNVLLAGETLRYTITVRNTGASDVVNAALRDAMPANTAYVANSTTLNGSPVADSGSVSPIVNNMPINSPGAAAGSIVANGVATITFDVVVNRNVANGTVISNQGFLSADGGIVDQPSDDPDTPTVNDPTRDVVGNAPLVYAEMRVALSVDRGSPGIVDPGDVLRYTITAQNSAAIAATGVVLQNLVPPNTTYVANSTMQNGLPVGQPDGGVSPLASGIPASSSDLTPPLPGPNAGRISPDGTVRLQYELLVNPGTPAGTVISTQAVVKSIELVDVLTDGDGNPSTGPEPTVVVVGDSQQLSITKEVVVVGGGAAIPGAELEYTVRVTNISAVPVINLVVTDDLNGSQPGQLVYVNGSALMNGAAAGVTFAGSVITANYATRNGGSGPLNPGETVTVRFRATLASGLAPGTVVTNTGVAAWNDPIQTASASASITVSGVSGFVTLSGSAWHDANFDDAKNSGERPLAGWSVDLYRDGRVLDSALTDAAGVYRFVGVAPNDVSGMPYELRFSAPGAGASTAMLGLTASPFTNGMQRITNIVVGSGANLQDLSLPIDPNGVIYNTVARTPIAGATVTLLDARSASPLPASCFDDAAQQGQITLADGYYKFDINFSDPACPGGGDYLINVTAPSGSSYRAGYSQMIPPRSDASNSAFPVPVCPASADDAIPGTAMFCEVQRSEFPPAASVTARSAGTNYHVHVRLDSSRIPGTSQIFNNHIPIDTLVSGTLSISKTTSTLNVTRGQVVPYLITVNNAGGLMFSDVSIVDRFPAGFSYVKGSAVLDGVPTEPSIVGRELRWNGLEFAGTQVRTLKVLFVVGAGLTEGEYVNRAQLVNGGVNRAVADDAAANPGEATATVRLMPDATFDCTEVTGKVFNDANRNGVQDDGEEGLVGVRVVTARGLQATTDQFGRYHMTCAITPNESRGSNFVLKLDDRTLPSGFRLSTDQVQIKRVTRGKAMRFNFGASIHRVAAIDLSDAVFEPGTTEIRAHWRPRLNLLLQELGKSPTVLRLSYIADTEDAALVERRVETVKRHLTEHWNAANTYVITIEPEVFWRRGAPTKRPDVRVPQKR